MKYPQGLNYKKSFTLIELIIVILIVGILSMVVIADFSRANRAVRLEGARYKLKGDLSYAQSLAVTQQINHGLVFYPANDTYIVYKQTPSAIVNNPLTLKPFIVNYAQDTTFKGVDLVSTSFGSPTTDRVEFNSFGSPSDGTNNLTVDGSVSLGYQGATASVGVTKNTGKVN
jgi:prepilin-type N-terminal cleavage/methylation domain-containing protein